MAIKVWDYLREFEAERDEIYAAIETVMRSGKLILGEQVECFEREFAAYAGCAHGIGVNSGTDALILALRALDIGAGAEVITVSNTAVPTVSAIVAVGATPVFVDIERDTYLMNTALLPRAVTPRTKAIIAVHLFGQCVDMDAVHAVARKPGLRVIEDCAQSHGATYKGRIAGSMSDISAFSFYPTKILGTYGDAGLVTTNDDALAARVRRLRFYGMEKQYFALEDGLNSRLDEIHAAILRKKLLRLPGYLARRREIARRYDIELDDTALRGLTLPVTRSENGHAYYLYVCRTPHRDVLLERLRERDIHLNVSYPWPIHTMPPYAAYSSPDLVETEHAAGEIFSLPMYPSLSRSEQDDVIASLHSILASLPGAVQ